MAIPSSDLTGDFITHNWKHVGTPRYSDYGNRNRNAKVSHYECRDCGLNFSHYYDHVEPDVRNLKSALHTAGADKLCPKSAMDPLRAKALVVYWDGGVTPTIWKCLVCGNKGDDFDNPIVHSDSCAVGKALASIS